MTDAAPKGGGDAARDPAVASEIDVERLAARLGGGAVRLERVHGGQSNPTFFVEQGGRRMVLRKPPAGNTLPSAHAVDREHRVMAALAETGVPVPRMILLETDPSVIGAPFYLMERLDGRVFEDSALPGLAREERRAAYVDAARALARLHAVDWRAAGLEGFGREGGYYARQVSRWSKQWRLSQTRDDPNIEALIPWLEANLPPEGPTTIVHGDYRIGNLIFAPDAPRVIGVLDWELSTLGDPTADLAHMATTWAFAPGQLGGLAGLDRAALGLPEEAEFLDAYRAAGGVETPLDDWRRAFGLFRFAVIFEGIAARALSGAAAGRDAGAVGALSAACAAKAAALLSTDRR